MKYYEAKFTLQPVSDEARDILSALLGEVGFETFLPTDEGLVGYIQRPLYDEEAVGRVCAHFLLPGYEVGYTLAEAPDEDWNQPWEEEGFEPIRVDHWVCVHDTRHASSGECLYDITINPRMAFGTGTHPTTQQILRQLCALELEGKRVVDAGCGTGVLGLLCSMRGADEVFAYDIDEWSVENTRINVQLNGIENLSVREGNASLLPQDGSYDLLIANINRNILLQDLPRFARALKENAQLLLSGFYETDAKLLQDRGETLGFHTARETSIDGWAMLLLER